METAYTMMSFIVRVGLSEEARYICNKDKMLSCLILQK